MLQNFTSIKHISKAFINTKIIFENKLISSFLVVCLPGNADVYTAASNFHDLRTSIFSHIIHII